MAHAPVDEEIHLRSRRNTSRAGPVLRRWVLPIGLSAVVGMGAGMGVGAASAHDGTSTSPVAILGSDVYISPTGSNDDAPNGNRVFLSSPRHADSGDRGECPGFEENINGRRWNWFAANGDYYYDDEYPTSHFRNLHARGYVTRVSKNVRDDGYFANRTASQAWGSDIHIITHSNAAVVGGCGGSGDYTLFEWHDDGDNKDDRALANRLRVQLAPVIPGNANIGTDEEWSGVILSELGTDAPFGDAYVELQFHTNPTRQSWLQDNTRYKAYNYGSAIDDYLGYP